MKQVLDSFSSPVLSAYCQAIVFIIILSVISVNSRLSQKIILMNGMNLFYLSTIISLIFALCLNPFFTYLLHWFFSWLILYVFWLAWLYISDKFGQPHIGEGWMAVLIPVIVFPFFVLISLFLKGVLKLFN